MGIHTDYLPEAESIRPSLINCPKCNCTKKYLQIYKYDLECKVRCPRCNYSVMDKSIDELIEDWNTEPTKLAY